MNWAVQKIILPVLESRAQVRSAGFGLNILLDDKIVGAVLLHDGQG